MPVIPKEEFSYHINGMARAHSKKLLIPSDQSMIPIVPHDVVQLTSPMLRQAQEGQAAVAGSPAMGASLQGAIVFIRCTAHSSFCSRGIAPTRRVRAVPFRETQPITTSNPVFLRS